MSPVLYIPNFSSAANKLELHVGVLKLVAFLRLGTRPAAADGMLNLVTEHKSSFEIQNVFHSK